MDRIDESMTPAAHPSILPTRLMVQLGRPLPRRVMLHRVRALELRRIRSRFLGWCLRSLAAIGALACGSLQSRVFWLEDIKDSQILSRLDDRDILRRSRPSAKPDSSCVRLCSCRVSLIVHSRCR